MDSIYLDKFTGKLNHNFNLNLGFLQALASLCKQCSFQSPCFFIQARIKYLPMCRNQIICLNWLIVPLVKLPFFYLTVLLGCSGQISPFTWNPNAVVFPTPRHTQLTIHQQYLQKWDSSFSRTIGYGFNQTYYSGFDSAEMLEVELCISWPKVQSLPLSVLKYLHCGEVVTLF